MRRIGEGTTLLLPRHLAVKDAEVFVDINAFMDWYCFILLSLIYFPSGDTFSKEPAEVPVSTYGLTEAGFYFRFIKVYIFPIAVMGFMNIVRRPAAAQVAYPFTTSATPLFKAASRAQRIEECIGLAVKDAEARTAANGIMLLTICGNP